jgi:uncharacterized membrane protein
LLGNRLLAGIAVAVPLIVTYWVLAFGYGLVNGLSEPWLKALGLDFPGLGFAITLLAFTGLGFMAAHVLGRRVLDRVERIILHIPAVSSIYAGTKQLMQTLRGIGADQPSRRVVVVECFVPGGHLFGFATGSMIEADSGRPLTMVFIPTAPNPTTGIIIAVPADRVRDCDLSFEEVTKMLFSGGLVTPDRPLAFRSREAGSGGPPEKETIV